MHAMPVMLGVLAILAVAYRYYSAFLAARVAALDDSRVTPAHQFNDGQNFDPTNRWVLFGHHFAAISGAGPLIGPGAGDPVRLHAGADLAGGGRLPGRRRAGHDGPGRLDAARRVEPRRARAAGDRPAGRARRGDRDPVHRDHRPGRAGDRGGQGPGRRAGPHEGGDGRGLPGRPEGGPRRQHEGRRSDDLLDTRGHDLSIRRRAGPDDGLPRDVRPGGARRLAPEAGSGRTGDDPAGAGPAAGPGQLVGHVHDRRDHPDRALCRLVHVPVAARAGSSRRR